jgi:hypothetical protein
MLQSPVHRAKRQPQTRALPSHASSAQKPINVVKKKFFLLNLDFYAIIVLNFSVLFPPFHFSSCLTSVLLSINMSDSGTDTPSRQSHLHRSSVVYGRKNKPPSVKNGFTSTVDENDRDSDMKDATHYHSPYRTRSRESSQSKVVGKEASRDSATASMDSTESAASFQRPSQRTRAASQNALLQELTLHRSSSITSTSSEKINSYSTDVSSTAGHSAVSIAPAQGQEKKFSVVSAASTAKTMAHRIPHRFQTVHLFSPATCDYCKKFMWGLSKEGQGCRGKC